MHDPEAEYEDEGQGRVSRSQLKREAQASRDLGAELAALSRDQLTRLNLPDALHEALVAALAIDAHGARKRQIKYIGGLLSRLDPEPIRQGLARLQSKNVQATQELHKIEQWRDRLLAEGDGALRQLLAQYPEADSQALRQLIRNAQKEHAAGKPPKSARLLFKAVKALLQAERGEAAEPSEEAGEDQADG
ncbi:ribosome biogenesis factor YjgA [Methylogaea oryzae]|nr:ribosome biogenesis factor YjgA [Methylogaea oryzae]